MVQVVNCRIPLLNSFTGLLASVIIFGYLGYFCQKYGKDMNDLQIGGKGLVFITIPACLSTMYLPNLWIFIFFLTMVLIGIDSQFGLLEATCYFIDDLKLQWNGSYIPSGVTKASTCLVIYLVGLPLATRGGTYVLELLDTFGFAIPCACSILFSLLIWGSFL